MGHRVDRQFIGGAIALRATGPADPNAEETEPWPDERRGG